MLEAINPESQASASCPSVVTNTRQAMCYNVTLRRVRATIVALERQ